MRQSSFLLVGSETVAYYKTSLAESLRDTIIGGSSDVMSIIESLKGNAEKMIQAMLDNLA